ncbi:MAG: NAD(P)H-dependent oxidoreductase [Mesorhizobium sp.]|nr:NADPH-dependent FMN reductase [Mesorhizobium sp.]MCO5161688.1 NAD(P)H-dependent oxidoreductase [Mesorhizobium sp.]
MSLKLNVITVSTRPGRMGPKIAEWFVSAAREHGAFEVVPVDLAAFELPVFDEPKHPRLGQYEHEHTRRWSASVDAADAFAFVTPEYNYFAPPSFVNAITYLSREWAYKPAALISYGGIAAGLRAAQLEKQLLTSLKVMPIPEAVAVPMFAQFLKDGVFVPNEPLIDGAKLVLSELHRWATALKPMRG